MNSFLMGPSDYSGLHPADALSLVSDARRLGLLQAYISAFSGSATALLGVATSRGLATALIDTGSKMDEVIFEEFKGTGNMELQLDRSLSNKRIFPAVNLVASSTRRDDLLQDKTTLDRMWILRKFISDMNPIEAMNTIHKSMQQTRNNEEFLISMNS